MDVYKVLELINTRISHYEQCRKESEQNRHTSLVMLYKDRVTTLNSVKRDITLLLKHKSKEDK